MLKHYLVRDGFVVHRRNGESVLSGKTVAMSDDEALLHAHQIELVKDAKADAAAKAKEEADAAIKAQEEADAAAKAKAEAKDNKGHG